MDISYLNTYIKNTGYKSYNSTVKGYYKQVDSLAEEFFEK